MIHGKRYFKEFSENFLKGRRASRDVKDPETNEILVKKGRVFTQRAIKRLKSLETQWISISLEEISGRAFAFTIADPRSGQPLVKASEPFTEETLLHKVRDVLDANETTKETEHLALREPPIFAGHKDGSNG